MTPKAPVAPMPASSVASMGACDVQLGVEGQIMRQGMVEKYHEEGEEAEDIEFGMIKARGGASGSRMRTQGESRMKRYVDMVAGCWLEWDSPA